MTLPVMKTKPCTRGQRQHKLGCTIYFRSTVLHPDYILMHGRRLFFWPWFSLLSTANLLQMPALPSTLHSTLSALTRSTSSLRGAQWSKSCSSSGHESPGSSMSAVQYVGGQETETSQCPVELWPLFRFRVSV